MWRKSRRNGQIKTLPSPKCHSNPINIMTACFVLLTLDWANICAKSAKICERVVSCTSHNHYIAASNLHYSFNSGATQPPGCCCPTVRGTWLIAHNNDAAMEHQTTQIHRQFILRTIFVITTIPRRIGRQYCIVRGKCMLITNKQLVIIIAPISGPVAN